MIIGMSLLQKSGAMHVPSKQWVQFSPRLSIQMCSHRNYGTTADIDSGARASLSVDMRKKLSKGATDSLNAGIRVVHENNSSFFLWKTPNVAI